MDMGVFLMAIWKSVDNIECTYKGQHAYIIAEYLQPRCPNEIPHYNTVAIKLDNGELLYYVPLIDIRILY